MSPPEVAPRRSAVAIALIAIGLVILVPSGLCTSAFVVGALVGFLTQPGDALSMLGMALIVGGPFVALGWVLVVQGLRRRRSD